MALIGLMLIGLGLTAVGYCVAWAVATERATRECVAAARAAERAYWEHETLQLRERNERLEAVVATLDAEVEKRSATVLYAASLWHGRNEAFRALREKGNLPELRAIITSSDAELTKLFASEPISGVRAREEAA
jgi:hypothetical protein